MNNEHVRTQLKQRAAEQRRHAYAPYSGFAVGAALLGANGRIYGGCNVENASYGLTQCAERNALAAAVADGCREFVAIAISGTAAKTLSPCGACRQVLAEFAPALEVIVCDEVARETAAWSMAELLPFSFQFEPPQRR